MLASGAAAAGGAWVGSARYFEHPVVAMVLCAVVAMAGMVANASRKRRRLWTDRMRGSAVFAAALGLGVYLWREGPDTNNLASILIALVLGALVDVIVNSVEEQAPDALRRIIRGWAARLGEGDDER